MTQVTLLLSWVATATSQTSLSLGGPYVIAKMGLTPLQGGCEDAMKSAIDDSQQACLNALHTSLRLIPRVIPRGFVIPSREIRNLKFKEIK